jgi:hypothetical protein
MRWIPRLILLYVLYKFAKHFVLPIYRASKKRSRRASQSNRAGFDEPSKGFAEKNNSTTKPRVGEYIDFEEIK